MSIATGVSRDLNCSHAHLSRQVHLAPLVAFVDGITRSGKSLLGPILSSLDHVEIERVEEIYEYIGALYQMGKISSDAAAAVLSMQADMHLYNSLLSRNTNYRFGDHSSVWRSPTPWKFIRRLWLGEGRVVIARVQNERPIFQNMTHDQLANFAIFAEAFGERLRMVEMMRHPVDLADSWLRRGWGERFGQDPTVLTFCIRHEDQDLPYYALGWEALYLGLQPPGRVVRMIARCWDFNARAYSALGPKERDQIFCIPFEDFVQRPWPYVKRLASFLGSTVTPKTSAALREQRCPRVYSVAARDDRRRNLEALLGQEEREILERLVEEFEEWESRFKSS
ncbi:MAG: hypothetical protein HY547_08575 [Elusimicrobia bacterium]|nr:hypothetical protein [Elusimicrobiota bacterium]